MALTPINNYNNQTFYFLGCLANGSQFSAIINTNLADLVSFVCLQFPLTVEQAVSMTCNARVFLINSVELGLSLALPEMKWISKKVQVSTIFRIWIRDLMN